MRREVFFIAMTVSLGLSPALIAQRGGGIELHGTPASVTSPGINGQPRGIPASVTDPGFTTALRGSSLHGRRRHGHDVRRLYAVPYYGYYVPLDNYADYDQQPQTPQTAPAQPSSDEQDDAQSTDSRYGEHYFDGRDRQRQDDEQDAQLQPVAPVAPPAVKQDDSPMTTLVYRDGHKSEVRNYAIVGSNLIDLTKTPVLKKIPLASLDLDATRKENEENGVEFHAP